MEETEDAFQIPIIWIIVGLLVVATLIIIIIIIIIAVKKKSKGKEEYKSKVELEETYSNQGKEIEIQDVEVKTQ